jgi:hypothetical protein
MAILRAVLPNNHPILAQHSIFSKFVKTGVEHHIITPEWIKKSPDRGEADVRRLSGLTIDRTLSSYRQSG